VKAPKTRSTSKVVYDPDSIGSTGLRQFGGFVHEEYLRELQGLNGARAYRQMSDNDPIIGAVVFAFSMLIRQAEWSVQAVDDSPEAEDAKRFVEEVLHDMSMPWSSVIADACSMFVYGYAPLEIVWKRRIGPQEGDGSRRSAYTDGKIGIRSISVRAQPTIVRWEIDNDDGSIKGLWQQPYSGPQVYIPIEKMLLFRTSEERMNPEGRSVLRNAYRPWFYKTKIENIEAIGVERDLAGLPVARIPGTYLSASADIREKRVLAQYQDLVTTIRRDQREGIVLPSDTDANGNKLFDLTLLSTAGSRSFDTTKIVDRYDRAIATSVLADFIFLGQNAVGSFALSSDKTALFATALGGFLKAMADVVNRHLLPRLWSLNGFEMAMLPKATPGDLEHPNIAELGDFIQKLTGAGATLFPDRELENALRSAAGLPEAPEDGLAMDPGEEAELRAEAQRMGALGAAPADPNADPEADTEDEAAVGKRRPQRIRKSVTYDERGRISVIQEEADMEPGSPARPLARKEITYDERGFIAGIEEVLS
jgi:hypothetical protein